MAWLRQECSDAICAHLDCPSCGCMAYITQALHQAQNDKLEEAAAFVIEAARPKAFGSISVGDELNMQGAAWAAGRIRSLKTPKD